MMFYQKIENASPNDSQCCEKRALYTFHSMNYFTAASQGTQSIFGLGPLGLLVYWGDNKDGKF